MHRRPKPAHEHATDNARVLINEAQQKQLEILREAAQMKTQIIEEARKAATVEAKKIIDAANVSIGVGSERVGTSIPSAGQRFCIADS